ncbi:hypothetical protein ACFYT4_25760 [Streptomyces sp. NPDC004609]|uniref:hypothetical protein n=1 Tax=Streptomyces sp. NPDC004609 TaxID=3364704 RepID=UPI0036744398
MGDPTYGEGAYEADGVIRSADCTGYLSTSDYVAGENGMSPDAPGGADTDTDTVTGHGGGG